MMPHSSTPTLTVATGTEASSRALLCEDWSLLAGTRTACRLDPVDGPGFLEDPAARVEDARPRDLGWFVEYERLLGPLLTGPGPTSPPPGSLEIHLSSPQISHSVGVDDPVWAAQASVSMGSPAQASLGQCLAMGATAAAGLPDM